MCCPPLLLFVAMAQMTASPDFIDVSSLRFGSPTVVVDIDNRTVQGELRRLAWSLDGTRLYLQTIQGKAPAAKLHHYTVTLDGGVVEAVETEPDWAASYWGVKQDRAAPGLPALIIEIEQKLETIKSGTGPSGVLDRTGNASSIASAGPDAQNLADGTFGNQKAQVVRLSFLGQEIAAFVNETKPVPGTRFSWGPDRSGALVFLGDKGELIFVDRKKHKRKVPDVKDAFLPAWSPDGGRVAYLRRTGRNAYSLMWLAVTAR